MSGTDILHDRNFKLAVTELRKRAERQLDVTRLVDIYVHTDLFLRTSSTETQLILGRRGTGKTHMIRVFQQERELRGDSVIYFDCTKLGSGLGNIRGLTPFQIGAKYFSTFLNQLCTELFDIVMRMENPNPGVQDQLFAKLVAVSDYFGVVSDSTVSAFNYRQITDSLGQVIRGLNIARLFLLIDEWAQVPVAGQPHFAEFIKRGILPVHKISVKILAVNYQCEFYRTDSGDQVGMQRGADFTDTIDIDTYLIYDEKREQVVEFFGEVLYNHLGSELGWDLSVGLEEKLRMIYSLFTRKEAFLQLVRAAEGNCRDFLCIFTRSYYDGFLQTEGSHSISISNVEKAASAWYDAEKQSNIKGETEVEKTLQYIFERVLKDYRSRTFMVEISKSEHRSLMRLLNERVLHKLNIQYSHPDRPGIRYDLFTLDFGAYIKFKDTRNEPYLDFVLETAKLPEIAEDEAKYMVPLDDKRSIRRIVFDPSSPETAI